MAFDGLLGNRRLKENLAASLEKGHISHFYLISGPEGSGKRTLARLLAAALVCRGGRKPCLTCPACRKVLADTHPDVITVDDPGKKTVPVELIRRARAEMYIRPNEAERKVFLFPRAQDMGLPGQNALLKVLEEPPEYGVFLLLTDNPERMLATVRSRCVELALEPLPEDVLRRRLREEFPQAEEATIAAAAAGSCGYLGQARARLETGVSPQTEALAGALTSRDSVALLQTLAPMEKWKRDALLPELEAWLSLVEEALMGRSAGGQVSAMAARLGAARSARELMEQTEHLKKAIAYTQGNASPAAVCGYLEWALR